MAMDRFIRESDTSQERIQSFAYVISVGVCVLFCFVFAGPNLRRVQPFREIGLDDRINPNNAPVASLARLPGIGVGRAAAIVSYRENFSVREPNNLPFRSCDDLQKVKGIGPKTVENIRPWLKFE
jgi:competence ComEA-like helix-hairpin-helix protein